MKKFFLLPLLSIFLISCKKDKLIDDKEMSVGIWKSLFEVRFDPFLP